MHFTTFSLIYMTNYDLVKKVNWIKIITYFIFKKIKNYHIVKLILIKNIDKKNCSNNFLSSEKNFEKKNKHKIFKNNLTLLFHIYIYL